MAKKRSFKRYLFIIVLLAGFSTYWFFFRGNTVGQPVFTTTTISEGNISQVITASGSLEPVTSVEVGSQVSGLITEVLVDFNTPVSKGQLLAKIDPATYEQKLRQAKADLESSKANHTLVRLNTERIRSLREKNLVSQQELDQAEANLAQADAALLTREAAIANAEVDLSRCSIYSPIDGVVLERSTEVGKTVAASLNSPTLFIIAGDLSQMQINAAIAEADIGSIAENQRVNFTVDAYPNREFRGRVTQIRNSPVVESNVVTYETIITLRNDGMILKPGMTANVSVIIAERNNVTRIANSALRVRMPKSLLPETSPSSTSPATAAAPAEESPEERRAKMRQLMEDAGFERGSGPPSPEVRARMIELAKERGITLSARGSRGSDNTATPAITTRTVYTLSGSAETPQITPVSVKLGITDGINTEILSGLSSDDVIITSAYIPGAESGSTPTTNPFSGMRRRM